MPGRLTPQLFGRAATAAPAVLARRGTRANPREYWEWGRCPGGVGHCRGVGGSRAGGAGEDLGFASQPLHETKTQVKAPVNPDFNPLRIPPLICLMPPLGIRIPCRGSYPPSRQEEEEGCSNIPDAGELGISVGCRGVPSTGMS